MKRRKKERERRKGLNEKDEMIFSLLFFFNDRQTRTNERLKEWLNFNRKFFLICIFSLFCG